MSNSQGGKKNKERMVYLLESGTVEGARKAKKILAERIEFEYAYYAELARQRSAIQDELRQSLIKTSISYEMTNWQRAVKYKYALHPLYALGSIEHIGGRFNMGKAINSEMPVFPGLYLAQDKDTALQEHLGQVAIPGAKLSAREIALTAPGSEAIVSVSGSLDKIVDLTKGNTLKEFVNLIKGFQISPRLMHRAKELNRGNCLIVKTELMLRNTLLAMNWRESPSNYDIPANSQIFGHLVYSAGIEGILYPSKFNGKSCLVAFPRNFVNTDSCIFLDDEPPHPGVPRKLDAANWRKSEMGLEEIQKGD